MSKVETPCRDRVAGSLTGQAGLTVDECVATGRRLLAAVGQDLATAGPVDIQPREAILILGHVLDWSEAQVRARGDRSVEGDKVEQFQALLNRRCSGEPVAYLTGSREFYGRSFFVDSRALIPRPETEHLIEAALSRLQRRELERPRILDVGAGSGCVGVTLACELPKSKVVATDLSVPALELARRNARELGVLDRSCFVCSDLASACRLERIDLFVSNPPYVAHEASASMSPEVTSFEPHLALFADDHGRRLIEALLDAVSSLRPGVDILFEIGFDQGEWIEAEVRARPYLRWHELVRDYAGHPRVAVCSRG